MFCTKCGKQLEEGQVFCTACGANMSEKGSASLQSAAERPGGFRCVFCGTTSPPIVKKRISTGGWIIFVILLLFCFPFAWVGILIKQEYRVCSGCGIELG